MDNGNVIECTSLRPELESLITRHGIPMFPIAKAGKSAVAEAISILANSFFCGCESEKSAKKRQSNK